jgi:hypothetical protein
MESNSGIIKKFYQTEISLFKELRNCISAERENLIHLEVKNLWDVMEEKNRILKSIDETKNQFEKIIDMENPYAGVPVEEKKSIHELKNKLGYLKQEIRSLVNENVSFINEALGFISDIVSIFTSSGSSEELYGPARNSRREVPNLIYHNEV